MIVLEFLNFDNICLDYGSNAMNERNFTEILKANQTQRRLYVGNKMLLFK
jgi:hypothetical protein